MSRDTIIIDRGLRWAGVALVATTMGCASAPPPKELVDARIAYEQAVNSAASELAPIELHEAEQSLKLAEAAFDDEPKAPQTVDAAYIALRKSERARARGAAEQAQRRRDQLAREADELREEHARKTARELSRTREALEQQQRDFQHAQQTLAQRDAALEHERKAREQAEKAAAAAMESLRKIAEVQEEQRGLVITLSGAVLFASGKSELLPIAQQKLDQVADMLKDQDPNRKIVVEGHTDSRGSVRTNEKLSLERADSVRAYLVSRGVPSDRIRAVGLGPSRPVADNATPEGRANNRRVEIVVEK